MSKNAFIDLIARLNKNKSKSQIKEDLKVISGELNGLKDNGLNIQCHIDTSSEAVNKLQGELNTLASKLKLNIGVDAKSIASTVASKTQSDNSATTSTVKIDKMSAQSQVEELGKLLRSNLKGEADAVLKGLLEETKNTLGQTTEIWTTWERNAEGALKSFSISAKQATGDLQKFNYAVEEGGKVSLLGSNGSDRGILQKQKETLKFIDEYTSKINSLRSSSNGNFTTAYNGETVGFKSLLDDLEKLRNGESSVEDIRAKFVALQGTIDSIKVTVKESQGKSLNPFTNANITAKEFDNTLKSVKVDLDNLKGFKTNNDSVPTVKELNNEYKDLSKAISALNQVEESQRGNQWYLDFASASERVRQLQSDIKLLNKLKREDTSSGTKKQTEELLKITHAYRELQKLEERRFSGKAGNNEINQINSLEGGYRRIINTAQDRLKKQELLTSEVKKTIAEEEKALNIARNLAKAKLQDKSITQESARIEKERSNIVSTLNKYKNSLGGFNNSNIIKQNGTNGDVMKQLSANKNLLQQIESISALLSNGKNSSAVNIAQAKQELDKLIPSLETAKKDSDNLNQSLKDDKITRQVTNKFNTLKNQIETFASVNKKATESTLKMSNGQTFKDNWETIVRTLYSGNLQGNAAEIEKLAIAFRDLNGQARSAGLTTNQFFTSMGSQLKMVLNRYISLYAVIGYIRKMVDNVKALDEAMINLRRVTDETDSGYLAFLEKANKQAQDLKVVTSDLVEQTYQWAKLGYDLNDALELSRASTIFSKVADVSQEQSLQNLITILKAYGIEAKNVMDIVDKMDNLNNRYAVSAAGLGEGLERSASALAMTGMSLDKSLALLTGTGEITQNLDNTGNALKIVSLRLRNMKGALEDLNEPVDDLMEVSKVQTQILNLTGNQVNIFDDKTKEFKDLYDIMEDVAEVWDSLSSTNRASLTEILFGKNRANIGLAIIQAFQSGTIQKAYKDSVKSAGTATAEYEKMMDGIESHSNALKGSFQELSNTVLNKETVNFFIDSGKRITDILTFIFKQAGSLSVVFGVLLATISATTKVNFIGALKGIGQWLGIIKTNADSASKALAAFKTIGNSLLSLGIGVVIGFLINKLSQFVDTLITTNKEMEEAITSATNDMVDLGKAVDDLKQSEQKLDSIAQSYSKIATTVTDVSERKTKLQEVQNDLVTSYKDEADGVDLVNGKYSEQLKKLDEIAKKEKENFELEHAVEINQAKRYANLDISAPNKAGANSAGVDMYVRPKDKKGDNMLYTLEDLDLKAIQLGEDIEGVYRTLDGAFDPQGLYLSGTIEDARNQLIKLIEVYERVPDYEDETLKRLEERLIQFNTIIENIKKFAPDELNNNSPSGAFGSVLGGFSDKINSAFNEISLTPFYNKLDEAQAKLQQLANPDDLSLDEYQTLYNEVGVLENSLYKMAGSSEEAKQKVADLFNGFKQGVAENGDGLDNFVQKWKTELDENFKSTAETVTTVQEAISKLGEGKGLSHTDAWKLLEQDADGYLQTIKLVNGEYVFSEQELTAFKDAQIKKSQETIRENIHEGEVAIKNLQAEIKTRMQNLYSLQKEFDLKVKMRQINSESDYKTYHDEIAETKFAIQQMEESMLDYAKAIDRDNFLVTELNQNLGTTRTISVGMETELNNAVKALENEVKAVDDTIDSLNNRKDVLESEKKELQEQLDILNEQKKVIEEQQKSFQKAVTDYMKRYEDSLKSQLDSLKQQQDDIKDEYEERIKVLKDENEERDLAYKKEKALLDLNKAKQQQVRTYSSARGWEYGASKEKVVEAQKNLDDVLNEEQIKALEKERDEKIKPLEKQEKALDHQIKAYDEYVKQYDILTEEIEDKDGELLAEQLLGSDWREKIEKKDEGLLRAYKREYSNFSNELERLTKIEIKNIEASIKVKENEIDKIGDEITAYNNYKTAVQSNLNDAKSALENYKNSMDSAKNDVISAASDMQHGVWENLSKIQQWMNDTENNIFNNKNKAIQWLTEWADAYESMQKRLANSSTGYGIVNSAWDAKLARGYADGGVNSTTGIAMLHGTKQKSETIFNANDSKKLYEAVHETPSVMASIIKQAVQLSGFNPSNVINNNGANTNTVNVNIGQVVANNPQDFVRNLDPHLDSYFKRKLTQSYTQ